MRLRFAIVGIGFLMAGCGDESLPVARNSSQARVGQVQATSGFADPTPTPEPPYLQLNVEPFLADSSPTEARIGVQASSENVAIVWSDLTFVPTTMFIANVDGRPDCEVAEGASATDAEFSFLPTGCRGADCQNVHAVVTTTEPNQWALLYSGRLVGRGTAMISVNASAASPEGMPAVVVTEGERLSWNGPVRLVASGSIDPSTSLGEITVSMDAGDNVVAGTQNDLYLDGPDNAFLATESGQPDCWANPSIDKVASLRFRPNSCVGDRCSGIRALVLSWSNTDPIPVGDWLYKCHIAANGKTSASFSNCLATTPLGDLILATGIGSSFGG